MHEITVKLQSRAADIIEAHAMVKDVADVVSRSEAEVLSSMQVNATGYDQGLSQACVIAL